VACAPVAGSSCGIFIGIQAIDHLHSTLGSGAAMASAFAASGGSHSIASGRLSYVLQAQGPCLSIDTACSASLVAAHAGLRALTVAEAWVSLAVGVNVMLLPEVHMLFATAAMTAPTGRCRTFDQGADGYARAEGVAAGTLLPSPRPNQSMFGADEEHTNLAWLGGAVRQDGARASLTAPNGLAQSILMHASLSDAATAPDRVAVHEAHGTGTPLGDPIEAQSLFATMLATRRVYDASLAVGSLKANTGHGEPSAALLGVVSLTMAIGSGHAPPNAQLRALNRFVRDIIAPSRSCGMIVATTAALGGGRRGFGLDVSSEACGGASSFGYSGTISHAVLGCKAETPRRVIGDKRLAYRRRHLVRTQSLSAGVGTQGDFVAYSAAAISLSTTTLASLPPTSIPSPLRILATGSDRSIPHSKVALGTLVLVLQPGSTPCATHRACDLLLHAMQHCVSRVGSGTRLWVLSHGAQPPRAAQAPSPITTASYGGAWSLLGTLGLDVADGL